jgi:hypothetical protein
MLWFAASQVIKLPKTSCFHGACPMISSKHTRFTELASQLYKHSPSLLQTVPRFTITYIYMLHHTSQPAEKIQNNKSLINIVQCI